MVQYEHLVIKIALIGGCKLVSSIKQRTVPILKAVLYKRLFKWQRTPSPLWDNISKTLDSDPVDKVSKIIKEHVTNSVSSRSVVYRELNQMLSLHPMYHSGVCETYRVDTTRLRLSSK